MSRYNKYEKHSLTFVPHDVYGHDLPRIPKNPKHEKLHTSKFSMKHGYGNKHDETLLSDLRRASQADDPGKR